MSRTVATGQSGRGQILVVAAAAMIVLIGTAAIVIDLGFSWMLSRQERNGADPGALAAGRYIDPSTGALADRPMAEAAACFYARQAGFFPLATTNDITTSTGCVSANDPPGNGIYHDGTIVVHSPPIYGDFSGRLGFVQVIISREKDNFFGRLLGSPTSIVVESAVASHSNDTANPYSLLALDPESCQSAKVSGGGTVTIEPITPGTVGGFVQVDSNCPPSGAGDDACLNGQGALKLDGGGTLEAPGINIVGECVASGTIIGPVDEGVVFVEDPMKNLPPPPIDITDTSTYGRCGLTGILTMPSGNPNEKGCKFTSSAPIELQPGVYYGGWEIGANADIRLQPGIYIIAGGGIKVTGSGSIQSVTDGTGNPTRVFIYSTDNPFYKDTCMVSGGPEHQCQGSIDLVATGDLRMKGLSQTEPCPDYSASPICPWAGMLIWQDGKGSRPDQPVTLGGQANLEISGTIYAPSALVTLSGGSSGSGIAAVQIISWQWTVSGGGGLFMPYDPGELYKFSQKGLVE
jgi:hypothetical protein